jgi:hypothetical protein
LKVKSREAALPVAVPSQSGEEVGSLQVMLYAGEEWVQLDGRVAVEERRRSREWSMPLMVAILGRG